MDGVDIYDKLITAAERRITRLRIFVAKLESDPPDPQRQTTITMAKDWIRWAELHIKKLERQRTRVLERCLVSELGEVSAPRGIYVAAGSEK